MAAAPFVGRWRASRANGPGTLRERLSSWRESTKTSTCWWREWLAGRRQGPDWEVEGRSRGGQPM